MVFLSVSKRLSTRKPTLLILLFLTSQSIAINYNPQKEDSLFNEKKASLVLDTLATSARNLHSELNSRQVEDANNHIAKLKVLKKLNAHKVNDETEDNLTFLSYYTAALSLLDPYRNSEAPTVRFKSFLKYIRKALRTSYYQEHKFAPLQEIDAIDHIQSLCHYYYHNIHTKQEREHHFQSMVGRIGPGIPLEDLHTAITRNKVRLDITAMDRLIARLSAKFTWLKFDPPQDGNITYPKFKLHDRQDDKDKTFIRMPTPTIGSGPQTRIADEFLGYLDYLKKRKLKHLYFSYQDNRPTPIHRIKNMRGIFKLIGMNDESYRTRVLEDLNNRADYKEVVTVLSLSKNSKFYHQEEKTYDTAKEFIREFLQKLFAVETNNGYFLPNKIVNNEFFGKAKDILNKVHQLAFFAKPKLTVEERQNFIEIAYVLLTEQLSQTAYSVNHTCKSGIDRAGGVHALIYSATVLMNLTSEQQDKISIYEKLQHIPQVLFEDALYNKAREITSIRMRRFESAYRHLLALAKNHPSNYRELFLIFEGLSISRV